MIARSRETHMRVLALLPTLVFAAFAVGQCPSVRPQFSWASNDSSIVFTDQTDVDFPSERFWDFGDGDTAAGLVETHGYAFAGDDTVTLTVSVGGCDFSVSGRVIHPGVNDNCDSQITSAFTEEQSGNNLIDFTDASQGDGSFLLYLWTFGDDIISQAPSASHFYMLPGAYNVSHSIGTVDSLFQTACVAGSARRVFVDGNTSTCDSSLFLDLSAEPNGTYVSFNAQAVLFNADLMITGWEWDYGDGTPTDITSLPQAQHYYAYGGDVQGCVQVWTMDSPDGDTSFARNCITINLPEVVGLDEPRPGPSLRARPVPFNDELWVEGEAVRARMPWRMVDALGREALKGTLSLDGTERIGTRALPPGIYTLFIPIDGGFRSLRLLKQ